MKNGFSISMLLAVTVLAGCNHQGAVKKPKQYTVNVLRDDLPVDGAKVKLVVWRKSEVPGAPVNPADVLYETQTDNLGEADIPVKRKASYGIKATACLEDAIWVGDAWVSRKSQQVQINLEPSNTACIGE